MPMSHVHGKTCLGQLHRGRQETVFDAGRGQNEGERVISYKKLSKIIQQPGYSVISDTAPPLPAVGIVYALPTGSKLEIKFIQMWEWLHGPALEREVRFCKRLWRFDFAHTSAPLVAIEIEGFGHSRPNRYTSDVEKYNMAAEMGWVLYRLTANMIHIDQLQTIIDFIAQRSIGHV